MCPPSFRVPRATDLGLPVSGAVRRALQATLCVVVLFTAYLLQQRFVPFLSLRAFNEAVKSIASRPKSVMSLAGTVPDGDHDTTAPAPTASEQAAGRGRRPTANASGANVRSYGGVTVTVRRKSSWFEPDAEDIMRLRSMHFKLHDRRQWLHNATVLAGIMMQRVMEDYNHLESTFLISGMLVLLAGLVFNGRGFRAGTAPYHLLTACVVFIVIAATVSFVVLIAVELYKSFRDAHLHAALRAAETASIESALRAGVRSRKRACTEQVTVVRDTVTNLQPAGVDDGRSYQSAASVDADGSAFVVDNPLRRTTSGMTPAPGGSAEHPNPRARAALMPQLEGSPSVIPSRLQRVRAAQRRVPSNRLDKHKLEEE